MVVPECAAATQPRAAVRGDGGAHTSAIVSDRSERTRSAPTSTYRAGKASTRPKAIGHALDDRRRGTRDTSPTPPLEPPPCQRTAAGDRDVALLTSGSLSKTAAGCVGVRSHQHL